jgi:ankyrin repeat protein
VRFPSPIVTLTRVFYDILTGRQPLHYAAVSKQTEIARLLLANGADVNARTHADFTPLHLAMSANFEPTVRMLIAAGAEYGLVSCDLYHQQV